MGAELRLKGKQLDGINASIQSGGDVNAAVQETCRNIADPSMKPKTTTEPIALPSDQLAEIVEILGRLPKEERERIIKTVIVFYGISLPDHSEPW